MKKVSVGVDIGGTNTSFGIVDKEGEILINETIPTPSHGDISKFIDELQVEFKI